MQNIRSYELFSAQFDPRLTILIGQNGSGKTTLLEAIYYLLYGTSFRGRDRDMIAHDTTRADLRLFDTHGGARHASLQQTSTDIIKKTFQVDNRVSQRLLHKHRQPVVLFEPDQLRLLTSSPERRRRFFDEYIARLYPEYATVLNRYQRTLLQRNELLKQRDTTPSGMWDDQLFIWELKFAELALEITRMRREFVVTSNLHLSRLYSDLAKAEHLVHVRYHSSVPFDTYQQSLIHRLHASRIEDSYRGYTSVGPHRDDFLVMLDGHPAAESASRGENRSIMLAYKLLEVQLQHEIHQESPIILLDDVFSELDPEREQHLMQALAGRQAIITATDLRDELQAIGTVIQIANST
jgi:DNA replication and repair protein RecF